MQARSRQIRRGFRYAVLIVLVVALQAILSYRFRVFQHFDLPLICSVYYGFVIGSPVALVLLGGGLGLLQDALSGALLGMNAASKTLIGFLAASAGSRFNVDQPVTRIVALLFFTLLNAVFLAVLSRALVLRAAPDPGTFAVDIAVSAAFNSLLGLILFGFHDRTRHASP